MCIDHDMSYEHTGNRSGVPGKGPSMGSVMYAVRSTSAMTGHPLCHVLSPTHGSALEWDSKSPPAGREEKSQRKRDSLGMLLLPTPKSALTCGQSASTQPVCSSAQTREMTSPGGDGLTFSGYNLGEEHGF